MKIIASIIKTIYYIFSNKRGEVRSPQDVKSEQISAIDRDNERLYERRRSFVVSDEVNIDGKIFHVNLIFDRRSTETVTDKLKYLIGSDTKN